MLVWIIGITVWIYTLAKMPSAVWKAIGSIVIWLVLAGVTCYTAMRVEVDYIHPEQGVEMRAADARRNIYDQKKAQRDQAISAQGDLIRQIERKEKKLEHTADPAERSRLESELWGLKDRREIESAKEIRLMREMYKMNEDEGRREHPELYKSEEE